MKPDFDARLSQLKTKLSELDALSAREGFGEDFNVNGILVALRDVTSLFDSTIVALKFGQPATRDFVVRHCAGCGVRKRLNSF